MYYVFLCGGQGKRFSTSVPQCKPYPILNGKPMYKFVLDSLNLKFGSTIVVVMNDDTKYITYEFIRDYPQFHWIPTHLPYITRGPCESVSLGLSSLNMDENEPFWVLDNDVIYDPTTNWKELELGPQSIYILGQKEKLDEENSPFCHIEAVGNTVINIIEKKNISELVIMGGYGFPSYKCFKSLYDSLLSDSSSQEYFLSRLVQKSLTNKYPCKVQIVNNSFTIGIPSQIYEAIQLGRIQLKPLNWVFDLDGTLLSAPTNYKDYSTCLPIEKICDFVRYLYEQNHHITIHTARHMRTCNNDVNQVIDKISKITEENLAKHKIPYHSIVYGKPYGDIYVDDKSMNPYYWDRGDNWTTSSMGFGLDKVLQMSSNNKIFKVDDYVCIKNENPATLQGYIYFLKNVPMGIRDHVPKLLKIENQSLVMQWLDGISIGQMFSRKTLDLHIFKKVLDLMTLTHSQTTGDNRDIVNDCMKNYMPKLKERLVKFADVYAHSSLDNHKLVDDLGIFFEKYKPRLKQCIHGDFWMSNLIWSHKEQKVYMIDMRGKIGDVYDLGGDVYYDYSKMYQSLLGFDWVINIGKLPEYNYQQKFINCFYEHVQDQGLDLDVIKKITLCLMYGSLPFHNEFIDNIEVYDMMMKHCFSYL